MTGEQRTKFPTVNTEGRVQEGTCPGIAAKKLEECKNSEHQNRAGLSLTLTVNLHSAQTRTQENSELKTIKKQPRSPGLI